MLFVLWLGVFLPALGLAMFELGLAWERSLLVHGRPTLNDALERIRDRGFIAFLFSLLWPLALPMFLG